MANGKATERQKQKQKEKDARKWKALKDARAAAQASSGYFAPPRGRPPSGCTSDRVGVHSLRLSNVLFGQSETLDKYGAEYCDELTGDFGDPYASDASGAVACSESDSELDGLYFWESDG